MPRIGDSISEVVAAAVANHIGTRGMGRGVPIKSAIVSQMELMVRISAHLRVASKEKDEVALF